METFGQKLREAVASRGMRLEDVAQATGFELRHLEALQRDEFNDLPDDDFVTEHLETLARLVQVDPRDVVGDFRRERERRRLVETAPIQVELTRAPDVVMEGDARKPSALRWGLALGLVVLALGVAGFAWLRSASTSPGEPTTPVESRGDLSGPPLPPAALGDSSEHTVPSRDDAFEQVGPAPRRGDAASLLAAERAGEDVDDRPDLAPTRQAPTAVSLTITEHGIGTGVVDRALVGEAERFTEGQRVWFWTRVEGAAMGDTVQHVWLHEGREALAVALALGGPRWRTHSHKTLHRGSAGSWAVEARDDAGRVLARRDFHCAASPGD